MYTVGPSMTPDSAPLPDAPAKRGFCTACNLKYLPGARAALEGVRRFHPDVKRYCFFPKDEVERGQEALGDLATALAPSRELRGVPARGQISVSRVFMVDLPEEIVAYTDADVVFARPAPLLWEIPPGKMGAVTDAAKQMATVMTPEMRPRYYLQFPEISGVPGFNSGVMSLRPAEFKWLPEAYERIIAEGRYWEDFWSKSDRFRSVDQPFFNALLLDKMHELPWAYNVTCLFDRPIPKDAVIVHFTARTKPWEPNFARHDPQYLYWARDGLGLQGKELAAIRRHILLKTPRRLVGQLYRRWRSAENFYRKRTPAETAKGPVVAGSQLVYISQHFPDQLEPQRGEGLAQFLRCLREHYQEISAIGLRATANPAHRGLRAPREPWMVRGYDAWLVPVYLGIPRLPFLGEKANLRLMRRTLKEALEIMNDITRIHQILGSGLYPEGAALADATDIPLVVLCQDAEDLASLKTARKTAMVQAARKCDKVITRSPDIVAILKEAGVPSERLHLIQGVAEGDWQALAREFASVVPDRHPHAVKPN